MGKLGAFLEITRVDAPERDPHGRTADFHEFIDTLPVEANPLRDARRAYGRSIEYSLNAVFSFVERYGRDDLVLVVLGDHQPARVSGHGAGHDVPVSVIARDPAVLDRIAAWGWAAGMRPGPTAPVWPMSAFRDRFLSAFGSRPTPS